MTLTSKHFFLTSTLSAALLLGGCGEPSQSSQTQTKDVSQSSNMEAPQVSVQLWSVKDALKDDFKGTLKEIAAMGFDGVEFAGDFGPFTEDPQGLKAYLKSQGLKASGAHVPMEALKTDFKATAEFYQSLGAKWLIVPWDDRAFDKEKVQDVASDLTSLAEKLAPYNMQVGFHNHAQEWADYKQASYLDYLAQNTPDSVILQQDVGWTIHADKDPIAFVKQYPGRTLTTHFKSDVEEGDNDRQPIIGQDGIQWSAIYRATVEHGGAQWIVLEQEVYPNGMTPLEAVEKTKQGFDNMVK